MPQDDVISSPTGMVARPPTADSLGDHAPRTCAAAGRHIGPDGRTLALAGRTGDGVGKLDGLGKTDGVGRTDGVGKMDGVAADGLGHIDGAPRGPVPQPDGHSAHAWAQWDGMPVALLLLNQGGHILTANPAALALLGVDADRVTGRALCAFLTPPGRSPFAAFLKQVSRETRPRCLHVNLVHPDGQVRYVQVEALVGPEDAAVQTIQLAMTDVSTLKAALDSTEALNATLTGRLATRTQRIRELNDEFDLFVQSAVHDLQVPLRRTDSVARLMTSAQGGDPRDRHHLDALQQNVRDINAMVSELASYFRTGRHRTKLISIDLERVIGEVRKTVEARYPGIPVSWQLEPLPTLTMDPRSLQLIFTELIDNALKFRAPERGLDIRVLSRDTAQEHVIGIQDNGQGFHMAQRERMFLLFTQLHKAGQYPGRGNGLALVRRIAQRHGGRAWAESTGSGSCFWVALPKVPDCEL